MLCCVHVLQGTFYNQEYSYITATVSINSSLLSNAAFLNTVSKGEPSSQGLEQSLLLSLRNVPEKQRTC